jgi:hypothetical protein
VDVKQWDRGKNTTFKVKNVEQLCCQKFTETAKKSEGVCVTMWKQLKTYHEQWEKDETTERIIIQDKGIDSSSSDG